MHENEVSGRLQAAAPEQVPRARAIAVRLPWAENGAGSPRCLKGSEGRTWKCLEHSSARHWHFRLAKLDFAGSQRRSQRLSRLRARFSMLQRGS
jgi:hypothetical protein